METGSKEGPIRALFTKRSSHPATLELGDEEHHNLD